MEHKKNKKRYGQ